MKFVVCLLFEAISLAQDRAARIHAVESGLVPPVAIEGHPAVKHTITDRMMALFVPGVSIAVIHRHEIDWERSYGYADVDTKKQATSSTLYEAASISKTLSAVAAMQLVNAGKIDLDEDMNGKLKAWKVPPNPSFPDAKVTLRRLLSHSAGLTVHGFPGYAVGASLPGVVSILNGAEPANSPAVKIAWEPGTQYQYSGGGYTVLQLLLTELTGEAFPARLREHVLLPAGMTGSTFEQPLPRYRDKDAATGYLANGAAVPGRYHVYPEMAAAGLWTTASDLARFGIEMQKAREGRSHRLLPQTSVAQMLTPQIKTRGLGFDLKEGGQTKWFSHTGADAGFQSLMTLAYDGDGLVVLTNSDNGLPLAFEILQSFAAAYGKQDYRPEQRKVFAVSPGSLAKFAGVYDLPGFGKVDIRVSGDHLVTERPAAEFYASSADTFFALSGLLPLRFVMKSGGQVDEMYLGGERAKRSGK